MVYKVYRYRYTYVVVIAYTYVVGFFLFVLGIFFVHYTLPYPLFPTHLLVNNTSSPAGMIRKKRLIFIICVTGCAGCANNHEPEVFSPVGNLIFNYLGVGVLE